MKKQKVIKALIGSFIILSCLNVEAQNYKDLKETQAMIRYDRFDYVLPDAMRNNHIDMWIVIDKGRGTEPMYLDFGDDSNNGNGLFIFTDRGGELKEPIFRLVIRRWKAELSMIFLVNQVSLNPLLKRKTPKE